MNLNGPFDPDSGRAKRSGRKRPNAEREIPLFPLNVVLFPDMALPLHIFEPRYRKMIETCLASDRTFGVALILEGNESGGVAQVWPVGTSAIIERLEKLPDGRYALVARGTNRFKIVERLPDNPYPRAVVQMLDEDSGSALDAYLILESQDLLFRYLKGMTRRQGQEWDDLAMPDDPTVLSYVVGAVLPCSLDEKQRLLQAPTAGDRLLQEMPLLQAEVERLESEVSRGPVAIPFEPTIEPSAN